MADPSHDPDTGDDTGTVPDRGATTGRARWQTVIGIIGLGVLGVLGVLVILMFGRGGGHGPGRHDPDASPHIDVEVVALTAEVSHR